MLLPPPLLHVSEKPQLLTARGRRWWSLVSRTTEMNALTLSHDVISEEPKAPPLSVLQHVPLEKRTEYHLTRANKAQHSTYIT